MADTVYRTGLTGKAVGLGIGAVLVGTALIWTGLSDLTRYSEKDPMRILFCYGPMVLGLGLFLLALWTARENTGGEIRLTGRGVRCSGRRREMLHVSWDALTAQVNSRGAFKVMLLSDGNRFFQAADLFVPGFERLQNELDRQRRAVRTRTRLKLD